MELVTGLGQECFRLLQMHLPIIDLGSILEALLFIVCIKDALMHLYAYAMAIADIASTSTDLQNKL